MAAQRRCENSSFEHAHYGALRCVTCPYRPVKGVAMGALAVLPSNKCGAHEIFHDWSIPPYTTVFVVPSVSRAFLWAFLWAFLKRFCGQNRPKVG